MPTCGSGLKPFCIGASRLGEGGGREQKQLTIGCMIILGVRFQYSRQIQDGSCHIDGRHLGFGGRLGFL